jgi:hypothetical protein
MASEGGGLPDDPSMLEPDVQADEQELRGAVRAVYQAFRTYKLHGRVEGCPCCVSESAERELRARPLREIEGDAFGRYVWKAMTTWGDVGDFKHFLPRILELLALDPTEVCGWDVEIAIGKVDYAKWNSWPEEERAPVIRFSRPGGAGNCTWSANPLTSRPSMAACVPWDRQWTIFRRFSMFGARMVACLRIRIWQGLSSRTGGSC